MSTEPSKFRAPNQNGTTVVRPPGVVRAAVADTFAFSGRVRCPGTLPVVNDRYDALAEIGRGGNGIVYLAVDRHTGGVVALKLVWMFGATGDEVERQEREARCANRVRHPNAIRVLDCGWWAWFYFLALEYAPGGTLKQRLAATGPLTARSATKLILPVVRAVAAAHRCGVTHRDLKPTNVLFDAAGNLKVADFGTAKGPADRTVTPAGAILGTPDYMAPEQARGDGKDATPAVDVWALGAVLYECVAGGPPFAAANIYELLKLILAPEAEATADSLQLRARNVPNDFDNICMKCLAKEPAGRYPTAAELADDLERFLAGQPVTAPPLVCAATPAC